MKALRFPWYRTNQKPNTGLDDSESHLIRFPKNAVICSCCTKRRGGVSPGGSFHLRYIDVVEQIGRDLS